MPFLFLFLLWPVLEIFVFIMVADEIGLLAGFLLAVGLMAAGGLLIQLQGLKTMATIQDALRQGALPKPELFDHICVFVAGALLLLPGFLSDVAAVLLLIPPLRDRVRKIAMRFLTGQSAENGDFRRGRARDDTVIDAEFVILEEDEGTNAPDDGRDTRLLP